MLQFTVTLTQFFVSGHSFVRKCQLTHFCECSQFFVSSTDCHHCERKNCKVCRKGYTANIFCGMLLSLYVEQVFIPSYYQFDCSTAALHCSRYENIPDSTQQKKQKITTKYFNTMTISAAAMTSPFP